jgi:hypothetical protein
MTLDCCPFCGNGADEDGISIETSKHRLGLIAAYIKCGHCAAQGGTVIGETEDEAIASAVRDWNQKDLRPNTVCHQVTRFFVQLEYDYYLYWRKLKNWDF